MQSTSRRFCPAKPGEGALFFDIIAARCRWFEEKGIPQWGSFYLELFPASFFEEQARLGQLYLLWEEERLLGGCVLLESDPDHWGEDPTPACYVHNFATDPTVSGAGSEILERCEQLARQRGKRFLRLDCAASNPALNQYYESRGFAYVCQRLLENGCYRGNLRQKAL